MEKIMPKTIPMEGLKFNKWTVIEKSNRKSHRTSYWKCQCDCGIVKEVLGSHLRFGSSKCCGCEGLKNNTNKMFGNKYGLKHGFYNHPLRAIRKAMLDRCYNENNPFYKNYGARGIKVCDEWRNSLEFFIKWALENNWIKGLSIDRQDNNGDYNKENCKWITRSENSRKNCILGKHVGRGRKKQNKITS